MLNMLGKIVKKMVFAITVIYGIDVLLSNVLIQIPINIFTISVTTILGVPGLLSIFAIF